MGFGFVYRWIYLFSLLLGTVTSSKFDETRQNSTKSAHKQHLPLDRKMHQTLLIPTASTERKVSWVFLYYHKTGHDLVRHFSSHFVWTKGGHNGTTCAGTKNDVRRTELMESKLKAQYHLDVMYANTDMLFPWFETFNNSFGT